MPTTSADLYSQITLSPLNLEEVAAILVVALPLAAILGFWLGRFQRRRLRDEAEAVEKILGDATMNTFLALLGLLLAFAFGNSLSVAQATKDAITNEAAALGTAFLRADYLAEPGRTELQGALLDYARTRMLPRDHAIRNAAEAHAFLERTLAAQARLWPLTLAATADPTPAPIQAFVAGAMNEALDAHLYRMATVSVPIAAFTQIVLLVGSVIAVLLLGNRTGILGHALTWRTFAFASFLIMIMYMVVDIRRGSEGLIRVDDSLLAATIFDMEQSLAARK
ncbi:hypothetical protein [Amaricoccus solimangrovi]|uniref:DUF4239 domain-containing protein n=1 Tax=Amaricoccus solimangrovi TaxID=2589815 RepID=A0A501WNV6_9RHOB|nr:hypothetical protein [Amaricoccus solimangrovi]TPE51423.1 hypothetical protein FJM51_09285 [Amaricoccus solimangrovi]